MKVKVLSRAQLVEKFWFLGGADASTLAWRDIGGVLPLQSASCSSVRPVSLDANVRPARTGCRLRDAGGKLGGYGLMRMRFERNSA